MPILPSPKPDFAPRIAVIYSAALAELDEWADGRGPLPLARERTESQRLGSATGSIRRFHRQ